ncbi:MAG: agmatinase [Thaumarchaeota archaeon]|nr:agmatinase [Nitrososphaerota archaeon]
MGMEFYGESYRGNDQPPFVGINTFLHLPWVQSHAELQKVKPNVAIIGEPFDFGTTIRPGARYGPRAIRAASTIPAPPYERFNIETGADPFGVFRAVDYGDVNVSPGDVIESHKRMTEKVKEVLDINGIPVMLGGDHSITFANVRAFAKKYKNIGIIHLDTHADCAPQGLCGFKYDHGAHIRRVMELGCLKGKNYTLIGPRGYWPGPDLYKWMSDQDFQWFTMLDVEEMGIDTIAKEAVDRANDGTDAVYLTWDIDSFDPAYAPGTGEPEPNGLTSREGMRLVRQFSVGFDPDKFAMDLVEVSPTYDVSDQSSYNGGITSGLGQRLIVELLAGLSLTKQGKKDGSPVRPHKYRGTGNTYHFGKESRSEIPKRK